MKLLLSLAVCLLTVGLAACPKSNDWGITVAKDAKHLCKLADENHASHPTLPRPQSTDKQEGMWLRLAETFLADTGHTNHATALVKSIAALPRHKRYQALVDGFKSEGVTFKCDTVMNVLRFPAPSARVIQCKGDGASIELNRNASGTYEALFEGKLVAKGLECSFKDDLRFAKCRGDNATFASRLLASSSGSQRLHVRVVSPEVTALGDSVPTRHGGLEVTFALKLCSAS